MRPRTEQLAAALLAALLAAFYAALRPGGGNAGDVATLDWPRDGIAGLARGGVPGRVRGGPSDSWAALRKWTPRYLSSTLAPLHRVFFAAPSADTSTASAGNATSIVSAVDTALPLQASLHDQYGNEVLNAPDVVVRVQGLDSVDPAAIVEHVLEGPRYSHTLTVPADAETTLVISFNLDGVQIGETAEIAVAPPPPVDNTTTYIAVGCSLGAILLLGAAAFYQQQSQMNKKRKLERVEREKELKLSMDEKLVKAYTTKMQKQRVYFGLEVGDVASDLFKPIFLAATFKAGREWFLALVVAVGLLALVQAYISIPVRRKMLKHYQGIIEGDMLHIYAEAEYGKKEGGGKGKVGEDNLKVSVTSLGSD